MVDADVDGARYVVLWWRKVVLATISNFHTSRRIRGCSVICRWDDGLSRLIYVYSYLTRSGF